MNKLYNLAILMFLLPCIGFSQTAEEKDAIAKRDKYLFAAKPVQKNFTITVPYISQRDQIIVPVVIAGETYQFLFDTGATTVISPEMKNKLGLKTIFSNKLVDGAGQIEEQEVYGIGEVQFGGVTFKDVVGPAIDLTKFEKLFCIKLDGILGTNIMRTCRWKIDYNNKTLTFSDKKIKPDGKMREIDFTEGFSGSPMLRQYVGEYNYLSIMDTGYNGGFSIPDSLFFKSRKSKTLKFKRGRGNSALTLFDSKPDNEYAVVMDSLHIGDYFMKDQLVKVASGNVPLTGNKVFKDFGMVIIDWNKHKIYLPQMKVKQDNELRTFGFSPVYADGLLQVGIVWDDSPAGKQGMAAGDTITAVNGTDTKNIPQEKWCSLLETFTDEREVQPTLELTVRKKDGTVKKFSLKKANLFDM